MDNDIDPKILEEIRKLSISSNVKFNRFFGDLTPETKNVAYSRIGDLLHHQDNF